MAHDIFISYGREDAAMMQKVDQAVQAAGLTTWTDHGIHPGSPSWKVDIETAIEESRCIVVLFSPDSVESRWVRAELDYAEAHQKPIYPLLVRGDKSNAVPFGFTSYQWIDVRDAAQVAPGLEQLVAALKGNRPITADAIPQKSVGNPRKQSRVLIPIVTAFVLVLLIAGIVLMNQNSQTASSTTATFSATSTTAATSASTLATALPTMSAFVLPDGYKKFEGEKTMIAAPSGWTADIAPELVEDFITSLGGENADKSAFLDAIFAGKDIFAVNFLRSQGAFIAVEDIGFPMSYKVLEARQRDMFSSYDAEGTFIGTELVEMPAGLMMYARGTGSDGSTFINDYVLARGTRLYHVIISGRVVDRDNLEAIGAKIANSFRIKS
jgi:hypothetical protein